MSEKVKKILFPTDFSDAANYALSYAVEMTKLLDAKLEIVHIVFDDSNIVAFYIPQMGMPMNEFIDNVEDNSKELFEKYLKENKELEGITYTHKILKGTPSAEIVKYAEEEGFDLIVLGTHGRTGLEHVLFGSNAELVVRKAPCPVLTVRPTASS